MNLQNNKLKWFFLMILILVLSGSVLNYYENNNSPSVTVFDNDNCDNCWWKLGPGTFREYALKCEGIECKKLKKIKISPHTMCIVYVKKDGICSNGKCPSSYMAVNGSDTMMEEDLAELISGDPNTISAIKVIPCKQCDV